MGTDEAMGLELKYCIDESPEFTCELDKIEDKDFLNRIQRAIMWALERAPEKLPVVPGFSTLRYIRCSNWHGMQFVVVYKLVSMEDQQHKISLL